MKKRFKQVYKVIEQISLNISLQDLKLYYF